MVASAADTDAYLAEHPPEVRYDGFACEGYAIAADEPLVTALSATYARQAEAAPALIATTGTTDARTFGLHGGIPSVCFGPYAEDVPRRRRAGVPPVHDPDVRRCSPLFIRDWCGVTGVTGHRTVRWRPADDGERHDGGRVPAPRSGASADPPVLSHEPDARLLRLGRPRSTCSASIAGCGTSPTSTTTTRSTATIRTSSCRGERPPRASSRSRRSATTCSPTRRSSTTCPPAARARPCFLMFDEETERLAAEVGLEIVVPPAALRDPARLEDRDDADRRRGRRAERAERPRPGGQLR